MSKAPDLTARMLELLEADSRLSNAEVARRLEVSEAVVRQRLRRAFESEHVRRGVVVDFSVLGIETVACLHVTVSAPHVEDAARRLAQEASTALVMSTTGPSNLFVMAVAQDPTELAKLIDEKIRPLKGFVRIQVSIISEALKYDSRYAPFLPQTAPIGNVD